MSNKINMKTVDGLEEGLANKADIDLSNSPYTTNRILEIPQDIKLELSNGTLTLKAGSKVYKPNGFESDGVTPKFDVRIIENDIINTDLSTSTEDMFFENTYSGGSLSGWPPNIVFSGPTAPDLTTSSGWGVWYDTSTNLIKESDGNYTWTTNNNYSLPFCIATSDANQKYTINKIFNGFGYVGSTVFALPGVKGAIPNGRNEDGTCKATLTILTSVKIQTFTSAAQRGWYLQTNGASSGNSPVYSDTQPSQNYIRWFSQKDNQWYDTHSSSELNSETYILPLALFNTDSTGKITSFEPCTVDSVANSNASNFSQAGRSYLSGLGMPSSTYENLTLGASGTDYTAPANGYILFGKAGTAAGQVLQITVNGRTLANLPCVYAGHIPIAFVPISKGTVFRVSYTVAGNTNTFIFIYAEGEN